ncbi:DUF1893 domain-containing protein [Candidatus Bathyarchaeota archaeon]|nr:DUF1893 domain-containing protein [Candidatus Bathyarchaeota archaeon]
MENAKKDLEVAKARLFSGDLTLTIAKNGEIIFESKNRGISSFIEAIDKLGFSLRGAAVADKVVGKAIALLSAYAGIDALYAFTLSREGKRVLEQSKLYLEWENLVDNILGPDMRNVCPFEKAAREINDPCEAYKKFKTMLKAISEGYMHE